MTELRDAIYTYFGAAGSGPLSATITGGLHQDMAPPGTAMPFAVYTVISNLPSVRYGSGSVIFYECDIQFTVYAVGSTAALALLTNSTTGLMVKFDDVALTLATGKQLNVTRVSGPISIPPEDNEADLPAYGWAVTYRFAATK